MPLCFLIGYKMLFSCLDVVGGMASGSRYVDRGRSSRRGRGRDRGSHRSPPLVHTEDPIQEEARGGNSVEYHAELEGPDTRDLVRDILIHLPLQERVHCEVSHHSEHRERNRSKSPRRGNREDIRESI